MAHFKYIAALLVCMAGSFVFLSWAMQTIWIASFPDSDSSKLMIPFYLELATGIVFVIGAVWVSWRWWRATKLSR